MAANGEGTPLTKMTEHSPFQGRFRDGQLDQEGTDKKCYPGWQITSLEIDEQTREHLDKSNRSMGASSTLRTYKEGPLNRGLRAFFVSLRVWNVYSAFMPFEIFSSVSLSGICEVTAFTFSFLIAS